MLHANGIHHHIGGYIRRRVMTTTYEAIAAIAYNASLVLWIYIMIVYFFIYRLNVRPWIVRGEVWKRITDNLEGGVSSDLLQSYLKIYSVSSGRIWMIAAELMSDVAKSDENKFRDELAALFPDIARLPTARERHAALRMVPSDKYSPWFLTALMNPQHIDEKPSAVKTVRSIF